jgi:prepilin-type N-terminal cleavage/methylation domain-containing protein
MEDKTLSGRHFGFTLIEVTSVIILVAIIAAFAVSRWPNKSSFLVLGQAEKLASDIRYTQSLAVTHNAGYRLNLNTVSGTYTITDVNGALVTHPVTGTTTITLASGTAFGAISNLPNNLIGFNSKGIPGINSTITTGLSTTATIAISGGGITHTVSIIPNTGTVSVS